MIRQYGDKIRSESGVLKVFKSAVGPFPVIQEALNASDKAVHQIGKFLESTIEATKDAAPLGRIVDKGFLKGLMW